MDVQLSTPLPARELPFLDLSRRLWLSLTDLRSPSKLTLCSRDDADGRCMIDFGGTVVRGDSIVDAECIIWIAKVFDAEQAVPRSVNVNNGAFTTEYQLLTHQ